MLTHHIRTRRESFLRELVHRSFGLQSSTRFELLTATLQVITAAIVAPAANVSSLRQLIRLNVKAPAKHELACAQRHRHLRSLATDSLDFACHERHFVGVRCDDAMITDRTAGEITCQIADHLPCRTGRRRRWLDETPSFIDGKFTHIITETPAGGTARVEVRNDRFFQNPLNRFDVDRNGTTQALDALRIISALGRLGGAPLRLPTNDSEIGNSNFDVTGDNLVTALDALQVMNALSRITRDAETAGESAPAVLGADRLMEIREEEPETVGRESDPAMPPRSLPMPPLMFLDPTRLPILKAELVDDVKNEVGHDDALELSAQLAE